MVRVVDPPPPAQHLSWQASLWAVADEVSFDRCFGGATRTALDERSWVEHVPGWCRGADALLAELVERLPWRQREVVMFERLLLEPRLTWWWSSDRGVPEPMSVLRSARDELSGRYGRAFDSIGCNLYRDGADSVAWHGDRVRHVTEDPLVAIVSLGEARQLRLRPRGGGRSRGWALGGGDLFVMGGACQHEWEHAVPKTARRVGPRLSVMFRHDMTRPARV